MGYKHNSNGQLMIESKADLKKRGMPSPDTSDALIHCFSGGLVANLNSYVAMPNHKRGFFV